MRALALASSLWLVACAPEAAPSRAPVPERAAGSSSRERVRALRDHEGALRSRLEPQEQPPWLDVSGADPYRLAARGGGFVGALRGSKALVMLDAQLGELARLTLPEAPTALCLPNPEQALVASRFSDEVWRVELGEVPRLLETWRMPSAGIVDLACGAGGVSYALTEGDAWLLTLDARGRELGRRPALGGGLRLLVRQRYLLESSLFERGLRVFELDERGVPARELGRIRHDGPLWGFDALVRGSELLLAAVGVEDRPLVRAHGEFENIDSFLWLYRLGSGLERVSELNLGELGLVVPKAVALREAEDGLRVSVLASGSGRWLRARFAEPLAAASEPVVEPALPGSSDAVFASDAASVRYPSPLFDGWVELDRAGSRLVRVEPERRPEATVRLGEALFFTELMAPENSSQGTHSRFSCETCHFEGGVDGRLHYTSRGDVSVVTKPLLGLGNNRPHFSRALDRDLSSVCHNEFRVAGAGSGSDPWFTLPSERFPWLHELGVGTGRVGPLELRAALMDFLFAFSHAPNPRARGRRVFSELEARGAQAFAQHCASCHAARLLSDDAASEVPLPGWQSFVLSRNAPIVWARGDYEKTGIEPYVHAKGTRIPSLRRLSLKPRYFTNGSSPDLPGLLGRFREGPAGPLHDSADPHAPPLDESTQRELLGFLQLL